MGNIQGSKFKGCQKVNRESLASCPLAKGHLVISFLCFLAKMLNAYNTTYTESSHLALSP